MCFYTENREALESVGEVVNSTLQLPNDAESEVHVKSFLYTEGIGNVM